MWKRPTLFQIVRKLSGCLNGRLFAKEYGTNYEHAMENAEGSYLEWIAYQLGFQEINQVYPWFEEYVDAGLSTAYRKYTGPKTFWAANPHITPARMIRRLEAKAKKLFPTKSKSKTRSKG